MAKTKGDVIDLNRLDPDEKARVRRALKPRDTTFSRMFNRDDIERWRAAAEKAGVSVTEWVEAQLNRALED